MGAPCSFSIHPRADGSWVSTQQDITEREILKERLDAALNNMAQGLAMFDGERRLVLCNNRYAEMYGLIPPSLRFDLHDPWVCRERREASSVSAQSFPGFRSG